MTELAEMNINNKIRNIENSNRWDFDHQYFRTLGMIDGLYLSNELTAQEYTDRLNKVREIGKTRRQTLGILP